MSVTLLGPRWEGERLRLRRPSELGLRHSDLVGWSDFYGGGPCSIKIAYASSGTRTGYLIWGGTLGLREVPPHLEHVAREHGDLLERHAVLWAEDAELLPPHVREAVEPVPVAGRPHDAVQQNRGGFAAAAVAVE